MAIHTTKTQDPKESKLDLKVQISSSTGDKVSTKDT